MLQSQENPPARFPAEDGIDQMRGRWWVAHCKPRQEKALAWELLRSDRSYFLPMYDKTLHSKGRTWHSQVVLFPGYLFLCGREDDRLAALQTNRLVRTIEVPDQGRLVRELLGIERLLRTGHPVGRVSRFTRGQPCRIVGGPLEGMEGLVERRKSRNRFVLMVGMLGQGAAVEIDADLLEPQ